VAPPHPENELPFIERLAISVHLSGTGTRQILLQLDSGSDGPIRYGQTKETELPMLVQAPPQGANVSKAQPAFAVLPPQDMRIGSRILRHVSFVIPVNIDKNIRRQDEDGLLPTLLFQRVFIAGADHNVVFDAY
jgi:hypothetical protein